MAKSAFVAILITLNANLWIDEHPLPMINELFASMIGGEKFSKIDLKWVYSSKSLFTAWSLRKGSRITYTEYIKDYFVAQN